MKRFFNCDFLAHSVNFFYLKDYTRDYKFLFIIYRKNISPPMVVTTTITNHNLFNEIAQNLEMLQVSQRYDIKGNYF